MRIFRPTSKRVQSQVLPQTLTSSANVSLPKMSAAKLEWSPDNKFEDRASTFVVNRKLPTPPYELIKRDNGRIEVITKKFQLEYDGNKPSPSGFVVVLREDALYFNKMYRYGVPVSNLGGTTRTLDQQDGRCEVGPGVISKAGFALIDDSSSTLFTPEGWVAPRLDASEQIDAYLFAHGSDYRMALKDLSEVSGHAPIVPRWALGNWWSRYHKYSQEEYLGLIDKLKKERLPFSVAVIDMDWHLTDIPPEYGASWTGYTWDKKLFPDHVKFLKDLHDRDLKVTLNDHPADGVRAYEALYTKMCEVLGRDASKGHTINFHPEDKKFFDAYFNVLLRSLEDEGVDFWWPDWQQGNHTGTSGIDPLWMLNHFHFQANKRGGKRPMDFSRYAGPGSQRYPIGFSGDTIISWASLKFQPEFTAMASNIGYGWWSHDIGGHHHGIKDDELTARWVQLGLWSPILRLHCTQHDFISREPWRYNDEARIVMERALRFRHRLVPYIYTMAVRNSLSGKTLVEPMYYDHADVAEAYRNKTQYMYGSELLVAPITSPRDKRTTFGKVSVWLPKGRWVDIYTSSVYDGDRIVDVHRPLDRVPVFAKEGAIVPLDAAEELENGCPLPSKMEVLVVIGQDGSFDLVEDDGMGADVSEIEFSQTPISYHHARGEIVIGPTCNPLFQNREWSIRLVAHTPSQRGILASIGPNNTPVQFDLSTEHRPSEPMGTLISLPSLPTDKAITVFLGTARPELDKHDVLSTVFAVLDAAQIRNDAKRDVWPIVQEFGKVPIQVLLSRLRAVEMDAIVRETVEECLLADSR